MTANLTKTAYTNTTPGSQCIVQAGCDTMWS
ncbi:hypothetical protein HNQ59_004001, partial [Chitinivorax tropicus]|nr:hypothetical protein [Chitinivorax tropicus]MBB5020676.1 hypothetical protein [Chitinivorax tropicus]